MTQELVVWVLIAGMIGLVWVLTCAMLTRDRTTEQASNESADSSNADHAESRRNLEREVAA